MDEEATVHQESCPPSASESFRVRQEKLCYAYGGGGGMERSRRRARPRAPLPELAAENLEF